MPSRRKGRLLLAGGVAPAGGSAPRAPSRLPAGLPTSSGGGSGAGRASGGGARSGAGQEPRPPRTPQSRSRGLEPTSAETKELLWGFLPDSKCAWLASSILFMDMAIPASEPA
ncbi:histone-lysine N-methyltransferase SETD1A-like [Lemur catta]|uniref:histone-lysine N-methyltransferase SETD1A-like n=1 Tax=Lemur catta TaxID=9447 RepID=UPI001E26E795|nr:histone-lysine N-methyltransferase SETD1A-like [Lemur catta]